MQQITSNKLSVIILGDLIVYRFKRYHYVSNNYFGKEAPNYGDKVDKVELGEIRLKICSTR